VQSVLFCIARSMSASGQLSAGMGSLHIGAGRDIHNSKNTSSIKKTPVAKINMFNVIYSVKGDRCFSK
jgi:hypothetical protein